VSALTPELLRERTSRLFAELPAEAWVDAIESVALVRCDRCGAIVDLIRRPFPIGWTTAGSFETGWTDLCRSCSG